MLPAVPSTLSEIYGISNRNRHKGNKMKNRSSKHDGEGAHNENKEELDSMDVDGGDDCLIHGEDTHHGMASSSGEGVDADGLMDSSGHDGEKFYFEIGPRASKGQSIENTVRTCMLSSVVFVIYFLLSLFSWTSCKTSAGYLRILSRDWPYSKLI